MSSVKSGTVLQQLCTGEHSQEVQRVEPDVQASTTMTAPQGSTHVIYDVTVFCVGLAEGSG